MFDDLGGIRPPTPQALLENSKSGRQKKEEARIAPSLVDLPCPLHFDLDQKIQPLFERLPERARARSVEMASVLGVFDKISPLHHLTKDFGFYEVIVSSCDLAFARKAYSSTSAASGTSSVDCCDAICGCRLLHRAGGRHINRAQ